VEAQVAAKLIPRLLDRGVEYHCRKKLRNWCNCDYCLAKKIGSRDISLVGMYFDYPYLPRYNYAEAWDVHARIVAARRRKVQALRLRLKTIKEEPLDVAVTQTTDH
jgi:hypothetical protein